MNASMKWLLRDRHGEWRRDLRELSREKNTLSLKLLAIRNSTMLKVLYGLNMWMCYLITIE
jgi:hypothetical protein